MRHLQSLHFHPNVLWIAGLAATAVAFTAAYSLVLSGLSLRWSPQAELVLAHMRPEAAFPLKAVPGKRHLVDQNDQPFMIHGDTAWSLIADLRREEVDIYLSDRRARGFNTLLVNLIEYKFARNAPANAYGHLPFDQGHDYSKPNEAYFQHATWVLERARELGFLVLLAPSYAGAGGGDEGWWKEMVANGQSKLRRYGRDLGQRFGRFDNIVWVNGGDYDPPDRSLVEAVVMGLKETAPDHLHTAHNAGETRIDEFWVGADWLDIVNVYTYNTICDRVGGVFASNDRRPFFLMESAYENEHGAGPHRMRVQAYHALLCGAGGQIFGNNPIWHFHHQGLFPAPAGWWQSLGSGGAVSMTRLGDLVRSTPWHNLVPEPRGALITDGEGEGFELATAARVPDGSFAVIYIPTGRTVELDLARLGKGRVSAQWFDPVSGTITPVDLSAVKMPSEGGGTTAWRLATPGTNDGGDGDWVLLLTSELNRT